MLRNIFTCDNKLSDLLKKNYLYKNLSGWLYRLKQKLKMLNCINTILLHLKQNIKRVIKRKKTFKEIK